MAERHILVIGGSGQLGRELTALPWPGGFTVVAPPRSEVEATDRSSVAACLGSGYWTAVINAAAYTAVDAAEDHVAEAFTANALAPAILADETRRHGVPLIQISTDYVFDGAKPTPYIEDDPVHPLGVYGASKLAGEEAVRTGNPRHIILRTSWLFGRFGKNFVKTMLRLAATEKMLRVVDDQHGTPTGAADLAEAIVRLATNPDLGGRSGIYHFANAGEATWFELAQSTFELTALGGRPLVAVEPIAARDFPTKAKRPANSRLSPAKIVRDFGIVPRPWNEALKDVLAQLVDP
jgi:dTDP-4-dehydrorhamnose reductase